MPFVYILKCSNGRFYIGSTINLSRRFLEHRLGESKYTKRLLPINLIFKQEFATLSQARKAECWLKRQKNRQLIEKIIREGKIQRVFG